MGRDGAITRKMARKRNWAAPRLVIAAGFPGHSQGSLKATKTFLARRDVDEAAIPGGRAGQTLERAAECLNVLKPATRRLQND